MSEEERRERRETGTCLINWVFLLLMKDLVKPFHVDKLRTHLYKLLEDVPQTLSPVLRAQHSVKPTQKKSRATEGVAIVSNEGENIVEKRAHANHCLQDPSAQFDPKEMSVIKVTPSASSILLKYQCLFSYMLMKCFK